MQEEDLGSYQLVRRVILSCCVWSGGFNQFIMSLEVTLNGHLRQNGSAEWLEQNKWNVCSWLSNYWKWENYWRFHLLDDLMEAAGIIFSFSPAVSQKWTFDSKLLLGVRVWPVQGVFPPNLHPDPAFIIVWTAVDVVLVRSTWGKLHLWGSRKAIPNVHYWSLQQQGLMVLQNGCTGHELAPIPHPPHPGFLCRGGRTGKSCNWLHEEVWIDQPTYQSMAKLLFSISFVTFDIMAVGRCLESSRRVYNRARLRVVCCPPVYTHELYQLLDANKWWDGMGNQVWGFPA